MDDETLSPGLVWLKLLCPHGKSKVNSLPGTESIIRKKLPMEKMAEKKENWQNTD